MKAIAFNKNRYHERMLEYRKKSQEGFSLMGDLYFLKLNTSVKIDIPKGMLAEKKKYAIGKHKYYMPVDIENYLSIVVGRNWQDKAINKKSANWYLIASLKISYRDFLEHISKQEIVQVIDREETSRNNSEIYESNVNNAWNIVQRSATRIALANEYEPMKAEIVAADKTENWDLLRKLLKSYDENAREYMKKGLSLCFDKEIFETYIKLLHHDGEEKLAGRMLANVPVQHLRSMN